MDFDKNMFVNLFLYLSAAFNFVVFLMLFSTLDNAYKKFSILEVREDSISAMKDIIDRNAGIIEEQNRYMRSCIVDQLNSYDIISELKREISVCAAEKEKYELYRVQEDSVD